MLVMRVAGWIATAMHDCRHSAWFSEGAHRSGLWAMLLLSVLMSASPAIAAGVVNGSVRVVAYNVMYGSKAQPEQVATALRTARPDVVLFSEVPGGDWTGRVGRRLGLDHVYVGEVSSANHADKYKSILSRYPLVDNTEYVLHSGDGWNPASVVRSVIEVDGTQVALYSLHLAESSEPTRGHLDELGALLEDEAIGNAIVAGDFNHSPGAPALERFERRGFRSAWDDLGITAANASSTVEERMLIDHVYYRAPGGARATAGGILELPRALSDHHPVWAEIRFGAGVVPSAAARPAALARFDDFSSIFIVAHRGCYSAAPENSVEAIAACARLGVDAVEIDVRLTRDGAAIVMHDEDVSRTTDGAGLVHEMTREQIQALRLRERGGGADAYLTRAPVPTLEAVLAAARERGVMVNLELKKDSVHDFKDVFDTASRIARETGSLDHVFFKIPDVQRNGEPLIRQLDTDSVKLLMPIIWESEGETLSERLEEFEGIPVAGYEVVFNDIAFLEDAGIDTRLREKRIMAIAVDGRWSGGLDDRAAFLDPDAAWGRLLDAGANTIMTGRPEALMKYLEQRRRQAASRSGEELDRGGQGYWQEADVPDTTLVLPPAPVPGSALYEADRRMFLESRASKGTARWQMAARDADWSIPAMLDNFSCAVGVSLGEESAPRLVRVLERSFEDMNVAVAAPKEHNRRLRPFQIDPGAICESEAPETFDYPSGHTTWGWVVGLLLAELAPDRATDILLRARAYGDSRVVCGVHNHSAKSAGELTAAMVVATLHGAEEFRDDMRLARDELRALRASAPRPGRCGAERELLLQPGY